MVGPGGPIGVGVTDLRRNKRIGYALEVDALKALQRLFPNLRRQGSTGYSRAAADLIQDGPGIPYRLVVTRDKGRPMLVTLSIDDLDRLLIDCTRTGRDRVVAQCKKREKTWVGGVYDELRRATSD